MASFPSALLAAHRPRPGCQTNAWRIDPKDDGSLAAVLDRIRGFGYAGFETSFRNLEGKDARWRQRIDATGLRCLGVHIWMPEYGPDGLAPADLVARVVDLGAQFGAERLILSGGPPAAGLERKAAALTRAEERAKAAGLAFAYHNHGAEFANAASEMNELLRRTSVALILDAGHAYLAGADFASFFRQHHTRIVGIHLRDFRLRDQVPLGSGDVDYRRLAEAVKKSRWSGWLINEEERLHDGKPGDSAVKPARQALKRIFGV